jgi:hypothetical protein
MLTLGINYLGMAGFINNASQVEVSRQYQTLITSVGFAFSIWSLIYWLLIISLFVMLMKHNANLLR